MIDEMIKLLLSQKHKHFIQQLKLMNVKSLMNQCEENRAKPNQNIPFEKKSLFQ
jgi:hypothetical protein